MSERAACYICGKKSLVLTVDDGELVLKCQACGAIFIIEADGE